ncbi:MAG: PhoH family protein [Candidatus Eisenbacteria bacterium]|uniref:PhoH-like protein n=1 Tax=Eiseniibacteriota bacterium TaxID=2212470 RepID=A0A849SLU1_UNCEI|nr:PhoH family protein [Candidatus Eisenbacteria bacterium]
MTVRKFPIEHLDPIAVLGQNDANLRLIERELPVRITLRDGTITVAGEADAVSTAADAFKQMVELAERGKHVEEADVITVLGAGDRNGNGGANGNGLRLAEAYDGAPGYAFDRKAVRARTPMQASYLKALEEHEVVFAIGPAGTGKTYLAVAAAVQALRQKKIDKIILVRPAVEAGENLGFLPGDMQEKVDPYLRPMYDALSDLMTYDKMRRYIELGVIEIAPLAFMRGRTLHRAFVILDEAQNTTVRQMKMFLTRLGVESRAVITGDVTQIDLKDPETSGLVRIQHILGSIPGIHFVYFHPEDVVRHRLVRHIIIAFDEFHARQNGKADDGVGSSYEPVTPHAELPGAGPEGAVAPPGGVAPGAVTGADSRGDEPSTGGGSPRRGPLL